MAAVGGSLDILIWAKDNGGILDGSVTYLAALHGHIHVLEWLHENKIPWNTHEFPWRRKNDQVAAWAKLHGYRYEPNYHLSD